MQLLNRRSSPRRLVLPEIALPGICLSEAGDVVHLPVSAIKDNQGARSRTPSSELEIDAYQTPAPVALDSEGVSFYLRLGAIGES